jgi:hypothetical protein
VLDTLDPAIASEEIRHMNDISKISPPDNPARDQASFRDVWSKDQRRAAPLGAREHETIGGGFIIVERTPKKNRLRPSPWPYELATLKQAVTAVERLKKRYPNKTFCILQQIAVSVAK